ncbi:MAG: sulfotransferase [Candidatus Omnitrophica bacterium]|nr:sulfotransferase [Candidatus Omnitrophota bacterium]
MNPVEPVLIGGAGRSGTTLVVDMLGLHPHLSPIYETDFVLRLLKWLLAGKRHGVEETRAKFEAYMDEWTRPLPIRPHEKRPQERYHHGPHYILFEREFAMERTRAFLADLGRRAPTEAARGLIEDLFAEHRRRDGKPRWVNKTPDYIDHLPDLQAVFPDMRFIHVVRDGRDVACSVLTRSWGPSTIKEAASWWREKVLKGFEFENANPDHCLVVRYEDLLLEPKSALARVFAWLGAEPLLEDVLTNYAGDEKNVRLDPSRIGDWRKTFGPSDVRTFERKAGDILKRLEYGE